MIVLILAAGYATRLRPLTDSTPKMLLPLAGRPMLDYLLDRVREVEELDGIHVVTNAQFVPAFRDWAPGDVTVHDDGTTSNDDRLGAIGDIAFAIERGSFPTGASNRRRSGSTSKELTEPLSGLTTHRREAASSRRSVEDRVGRLAVSGRWTVCPSEHVVTSPPPSRTNTFTV